MRHRKASKNLILLKISGGGSRCWHSLSLQRFGIVNAVYCLDLLSHVFFFFHCSHVLAVIQLSPTFTAEILYCRVMAVVLRRQAVELPRIPYIPGSSCRQYCRVTVTTDIMLRIPVTLPRLSSKKSRVQLCYRYFGQITAIACLHYGDYQYITQGSSRIMTRPAGRVRTFSKPHGPGRVGSRGFEVSRVGSGQVKSF